MIEEIAQIDPAIGIQARWVKKKANPHLFHQINRYLDQYCLFSEVDPKTAAAYISKFSRRYLDDLIRFKETGKYPKELDQNSFTLSRAEYDVFLISSMLFTWHRHQIAEALYSETTRAGAGKTAFVGAGSGVEIALAGKDGSSVTAFDLSLSPFIRQKFKHIGMVEDEFGLYRTYDYDTIYAIELLEHLNDPWKLLKRIYDALKKGGRLICTIAINVPQFDHLFNFQEHTFETAAKNFFHIERKTKIRHDYKMIDCDSQNLFYEMVKRSG